MTKLAKPILLLTGLMRNFADCLDYLVKNKAFSRYQVSLSSWTGEVKKNFDLVNTFVKYGGSVVIRDPVDFGPFTSVVSQHLSLSNYLAQDIPEKQIVIKTRTDSIVKHDFLSILSDHEMNFDPEKIFVSGFVPSSPYFLADMEFAGSARKLREISILDLNFLISYPLLHPEQAFFTPSFDKRSSELNSWLGLDCGTFYSLSHTQEWSRIRLQSPLYYFVIGEYLSWIDDNVAFFFSEKFANQELNSNTELKFNDFLFGNESDTRNSHGLIMRRDAVNYGDINLTFDSILFRDYFKAGYDGNKLDKDDLANRKIELRELINESEVLRDPIRGLQHYYRVFKSKKNT